MSFTDIAIPFNFVRYDANGKILNIGNMDSGAIEYIRGTGDLILQVDLPEDFDPSKHKVDLSTLTIVEKPPEEIEQAPPPINPANNVPIIDISNVPVTINTKQFYQQAAIQGLITNSEALQGVRGNIPQPIQTILNGVTDSNQRFSMEMALSTNSWFGKDDPTMVTILGSLNVNIDQFFDAAKVL